MLAVVGSGSRLDHPNEFIESRKLVEVIVTSQKTLPRCGACDMVQVARYRLSGQVLTEGPVRVSRGSPPEFPVFFVCGAESLMW